MQVEAIRMTTEELITLGINPNYLPNSFRITIYGIDREYLDKGTISGEYDIDEEYVKEYTLEEFESKYHYFILNNMKSDYEGERSHSSYYDKLEEDLHLLIEYSYVGGIRVRCDDLLLFEQINMQREV